VQRAVRHHAIEQSALFDEFNEERHLPKRRTGALLVSFNIDAGIRHDKPSR
jgi:hypothetical protein